MVEYSVLIIDDDIWMQRILSKTLSSYGFKKNYLASNGFEGVAKAVEYQPHLIILDILMPELTGHLTLKMLKSIKLTRDIPVIMVSALSDIENLGLAVKSGTAGFISKPFTRATVYEKLVDIYGKEKLDMISKGEAIDEEGLGIYNEHDIEINEKPFKRSGKPSKKSTDQPPGQVSQDKLLRHYHDDEKRSIESIKKLLLKSRK